MKFLFLIYHDETRDQSLGAKAMAALQAANERFLAELWAAKKLVSFGPLAPAAMARTVRLRDESVLVSDGPFAETIEQVGGYLVIDCNGPDEAQRYAQTMPRWPESVVEFWPVGALQENRSNLAAYAVEISPARASFQ